MASVSQDLRKILRPFRAKADVFALSLFGADVAMYVLFTALAIAHPWPVVQFAASIPAGVLLAVLFVVGHDACHGSFTSRRWLNALIGRNAFLPTLTPYTTWELSHNLTHHVYTNFRPLDYLWAPLTKPEFDALPRWRRELERIYRHPLGLALYYPIEIWWKRLLFPRGRSIYFADSALCAAAFFAMLALTLRHGFGAVVFGMLVPFAVWSWLMSWALLAQHTHPDVPWFDDEHEWRAAQSRSTLTVHLIAPGPLNFMLHRIMEHTAHHLDVTVPLYRLAAAQEELERMTADLVVERWTPHSFIRHLRTCKLYDYGRRQWQDFDGNPTSRPIL